MWMPYAISGALIVFCAEIDISTNEPYIAFVIHATDVHGTESPYPVRKSQLRSDMRDAR